MSDQESTPVVPTKQCSKCKELFPATPEYFHDDKTGKYGFYSQCRPCKNQSARAFTAQYPERRKAARDQYARLHHDRQRARYKRYHQANSAMIRAKKAAYIATRKDVIRQQRATYYAIHRRKELAMNQRYKKANPDKMRELGERRRSRKANAAISDFTPTQWRHMQEHYKHRCVYCGKYLPGKLTQDHITPLSKGGNHTASNIVPACKSCNCKKRDKAPLVAVQPILLL